MNRKLENLIATWRTWADMLRVTATSRAITLERCANELEQILKVYGESNPHVLISDKEYQETKKLLDKELPI